MKKERIVVFGGTGFLGLSLADYLKNKGFELVLIARNKPKQDIGHQFVEWDGYSVGEWKCQLDGVKAVVNLVGKSVDCIKTPDNCDLILRSRVDATKAIGDALREVKNSPNVWIQMSTAHMYGDSPTRTCTESSAFGYGLAPFVGERWENALKSVLSDGMREVRLRTSFVIGKNGGALAQLKRLVRLGLGGTVGNGKQGMSWIHQEDINEIIYQAITNDKYHGAYIVSAPNPVSNKEFMKTLRKKMKAVIGLPSPEFLVRLGAKLFFKTDPELALYGRYVVSERLENEGFVFQYPDLDEALSSLV